VSIARTDRSNEKVRSLPAAGRDLVLAHLGGDPDAFDDIVRRYYPALQAHARRRLFDDRLAEDAVQEAFLKAYRALPGFSGEYQLGAWLHRIVSNVCNDEGARRNRETQANERWAALVEPEAAGPEEHGEREEVRARVAAAVNELPANYREALVLRDVMDYEYADVAVAAGISEDNARARVSRARAALRRLVEGSVALGGAFVGGFKRAGRWVPKLSYHLSNSAGVTDAAVASTRSGPMITLATTGVAAAAVVVASAVPLFSAPPAPTKPPPSFAVTAGPQPPATAPIAAGGAGTTATLATLKAGQSVAPVTAPSSKVSTSATPSTAAPRPPGTVLVIDPPSASTLPPAPPPVTVVTTLSGPVKTDSGGGLTELPGHLSIAGGSTEGFLTTQLTLPAAGAPVCSGYLVLKFVWLPAGASRPSELTATTTLFSVVPGPTSTVYQLDGLGQVSGATGGLSGTVWLNGSLTAPSDGSSGQVSATVSEGQGSPGACQAGTTPTTVPSTTVPTTVAPTTAPPTLTPSTSLAPDQKSSSH